MKKYDSEVYLEPLIDKGDEYWIGWSFDNRWYKGVTFRSLLEDTNGNRLYTNANPNLQAVNENGQSIHGSWGGGGSTYNFGFNVSKEMFNESKRIDIKSEGFNLMHYKFSCSKEKVSCTLFLCRATNMWRYIVPIIPLRGIDNIMSQVVY